MLHGEGMKFQGYSGQTPVIFPQLLGGDHRALYKSGDCRSIYTVRENGKLKAPPEYPRQTAGIRLLKLVFSHFQLRPLPERAVPVGVPLSATAPHWTHVDVRITFRGLGGERRLQSETVVSCCTPLNAMLPCNMHWYCMTAARRNLTGETTFVFPDEDCPTFYSSSTTIQSF